VTPPDSYLALERGMAEGMAFPLAPCRAFKITEVAKYHTIFSAMTDPFYGAINIGKWNSLPPDLQKILINTTGRKLSWICGQTLDGGDSRDSEALKNEGHKFYILPPDEKQRWAEKVKDIPEKWLKDMKKKNIKGAKQVLEKVIMKGAAYSKIAPGGFK
jgi:TRAP-type C4-dicarboxylate transport system substrate-binding protein